MFNSGYEDDDDYDDELELCESCGNPLFLCNCESSGEDEILICHHCENRLDNEELGITFHVCEECAAAVCAKCALPVVDESGEPCFICVDCGKKLIGQKTKGNMGK